MKIAVYGTGQKALFFLSQINYLSIDVDIVYFVETKKKKDSFRRKKVISVCEMDYSDFEYLVIATGIEYYEEIISYLKNNTEFDYYEDKVISYSKFMTFFADKPTRPYVSVELDNSLKFIASSSDTAIALDMLHTHKVYSEQLIFTFFELVNKYYGPIDNANIFFDIGANIGTTSILVKKVIDPKLRIVAFEIGEDNYDLLRVNCIINHVEDIEAEFIGLSDVEGTVKYVYSVDNPGGSHILMDDSADKAEQGKDCVSMQKVTTLDNYIKSKHINKKDIAYLWVDAEGHEAEIVLGMKDLLKEKKVPLLQEFNWRDYVMSGKWEDYKKLISSVYSHFICLDEYMAGICTVYPIQKLSRFVDNMEIQNISQIDMFFF